jgi:hypothetical protein
MEKTRPKTNEPPKPASKNLADEKSSPRAQKRLATQSERDEMAELSPQTGTDSRSKAERSVEGK